MTRMTYSDYLRLEELLSLQRPLTPSDHPDLRDSERLFIVVHQSSETLLGQALVDLAHIESGDCGEACHSQRADRVARLLSAMEENLELLRTALPPEHFHRFRGGFGTASGLQSEQFHELFARVGRSRGAHRDRLVAALRGWLRSHIKLVDHMNGGLPGTGGTAGVRYLERRLACPAMQPGPRTNS